MPSRFKDILETQRLNAADIHIPRSDRVSVDEFRKLSRDVTDASTPQTTKGMIKQGLIDKTGDALNANIIKLIRVVKDGFDKKIKSVSGTSSSLVQIANTTDQSSQNDSTASLNVHTNRSHNQSYIRVLSESFKIALKEVLTPPLQRIIGSTLTAQRVNSGFPSHNSASSISHQYSTQFASYLGSRNSRYMIDPISGMPVVPSSPFGLSNGIIPQGQTFPAMRANYMSQSYNTAVSAPAMRANYMSQSYNTAVSAQMVKGIQVPGKSNQSVTPSGPQQARMAVFEAAETVPNSGPTISSSASRETQAENARLIGEQTKLLQKIEENTRGISGGGSSKGGVGLGVGMGLGGGGGGGGDGGGGFPPLIPGIVGGLALGGVLRRFGGRIVNGFRAAGGAVGRTAKAAVSKVGGAARRVGQAALSSATSLGSKAAPMIAPLTNAATNVAKGAGNAVVKGAEVISEAATRVAPKTTAAVSTVAKGAGKAIAGVAKSGVNAATKIAPAVGKAAGVASKVGSVAGTAAKGILGKLGPIAMAGMAVYDGVTGYNNATENLGIQGRDATFGEKMASSGGSVLSGLTFGLLDEKTASQKIAGLFGAGDPDKVDPVGKPPLTNLITNNQLRIADHPVGDTLTPAQVSVITQSLQQGHTYPPEIMAKYQSAIEQSYDLSSAVNPTTNISQYRQQLVPMRDVNVLSQPQTADMVYHQSGENAAAGNQPIQPPTPAPVVINAPTNVSNTSNMSVRSPTRNTESSYQSYERSKFAMS